MKNHNRTHKQFRGYISLSLIVIWLAAPLVNAQSTTDVPASETVEQTSTIPNNRGSVAFGFGLGRYALTKDSENSNGLSSGNTGFELYTSYSPSPLITFELVYNGFTMEDSNSFSTIRVNDDGFIGLVNSETKARLWKAAFSLNHRLRNRSVGYSFGSGYSLLSVERKIDKCESCNVDELELDGGGFVFGNVNYYISNRSQLELSLTHYLSGDLDNNVIVRWKILSRK